MDESGTRREVPRVCITDGKQHIRRYLREALNELGFSTYECVEAEELSAALDAAPPSLVVLGLSGGEVQASEMLKVLASNDFHGKVLPFAPRSSSVIAIIQALAETLGIAMLPALLLPLSNARLRQSVALLLRKGSWDPLVDLEEAIRANWLELWYQPKIDTRAIVMRGVEALLRLRHPTWGIVPPEYFIANDGDPRLRSVSETVIGCAIYDWNDFFAENGPVEIAINLPIAFLRDPDSISRLCQSLPDHPAFEGLIIEINGTDIVRNLTLAKDLAKQLRSRKIAISVDDLGAEWASLAGLRDFPFVEIKVDRNFVTGCADDELKQSMCCGILELASGYGARTVAEGVETWADFLAVREMGFDLVQGFLFAKPVTAEKFGHTCWGAPRQRPSSARSASIRERTVPPSTNNLAKRSLMQ
jgi:EAL domain-containing protein (putative c-di-GMP-specific phosphodiesterase class I)